MVGNDVREVFLVKEMCRKGKKGRGGDEGKGEVVVGGKRKMVGVEEKSEED